jgi:hypothetical protein
MIQVLRIRDFRFLWGAGLVSSIGSWLLVLAVPAHIFLVTRSLAATDSRWPQSTCRCCCSGRLRALSRTAGTGGA